MARLLRLFRRSAFPLAAIAALTLFAGWRCDVYRHRVAPTVVSPRPFDPAGWASGSATLRHGMARHLIERGELIGLSRAEVTDRLGRPDGGGVADYFEWRLGERQDPTGLIWNYDESLRVYFDERGVCREAVVWSRD